MVRLLTHSTFVRKPSTGMVERAVRESTIDLQRSVVIGGGYSRLHRCLRGSPALEGVVSRLTT